MAQPKPAPPVVPHSPSGQDTTPKPTTFKIPIGGTTDLRQADTLPPPDTTRPVMVMPGPGFRDARPDSAQAAHAISDNSISPAPVDTSKAVDLHAQTRITDELPRRSEVVVWNYLQLPKGGFESKWYNQLYTQKSYFDASGAAVPQGNRSSYLSSILQLSYGLNDRINIGLDAWMQSVRISPETSGPFALFGGRAGTTGRTALTTAGPRVRIALGPILLQSSFLIPLARDPEGRNNGMPFLATENFICWTQASNTLGTGNWQLYNELGIYWNINRGDGNGFLAIPLTAIGHRLLFQKRAAIMALVQAWPTLGRPVLSAWWLQSGLGMKLALNSSVSLEAMYSRFLAGQSAAGPAQAFNIGLRHVLW